MSNEIYTDQTVSHTSIIDNTISNISISDQYYEYLSEQIYRDCSRNKRCLSCIHWNGFICNATNAFCDFQPG